MLATLISPAEGEIFLFGESLKNETVKIRQRIGLIGHGSMLYRDLSAIENLVFFGRLYGVSDPKTQAERLLDYVGLASRGHDPVKAFSRGMIQRVSIARALMHDPDILLADEPFNGLDTRSGRVLVDLLRDLSAKSKTIILATHDVHLTMALADQIVVLRHGQVVINERAEALSQQVVLDAIEIN